MKSVYQVQDAAQIQNMLKQFSCCFFFVFFVFFCLFFFMLCCPNHFESCSVSRYVTFYRKIKGKEEEDGQRCLITLFVNRLRVSANLDFHHGLNFLFSTV